MLLLRRFGLAAALVVAVGLSGCSSADPGASADFSSGSVAGEVGDGEANQPAPEDSAAESVVEVGETPTSVDGRAADQVSTTVEPLRPAGEPQPTTSREAESTSAYISRRSMTSDAIEVHWSDTEGVAEFQIHRLPRASDEKPSLGAMTAENRIHVADAGGRFVDETVEDGTEYWHGVRELSAAGVVTAHGWHRTVAIDDEEPPSAVEVKAVVEDGGVLVTWTQPEENYQLHSYRVYRGVDGEPPESIAVTWRLDQRSFLDDAPPVSADVVYEVVASDFHWNESTPGRVMIDLS